MINVSLASSGSVVAPEVANIINRTLCHKKQEALIFILIREKTRKSPRDTHGRSSTFVLLFFTSQEEDKKITNR